MKISIDGISATLGLLKFLSIIWTFISGLMYFFGIAKLPLAVIYGPILTLLLIDVLISIILRNMARYYEYKKDKTYDDDIESYKE